MASSSASRYLDRLKQDTRTSWFLLTSTQVTAVVDESFHVDENRLYKNYIYIDECLRPGMS